MNLVTRDVGRMFFGIDLQCAQCHDHRYDPIPQTDYYALRGELIGFLENEDREKQGARAA